MIFQRAYRDKLGRFRKGIPQPWKRRRAIVRCKGCGKLFEVVKHDAKWRKYCSAKCGYRSEHHRKILSKSHMGFKVPEERKKKISQTMKRRGIKPVCLPEFLGFYSKCKVCGKKIYVPKSQKNRKKYCSDKCARIARNKKVKKRCKICGKEFYVSPCAKDSLFCSQRCYHIAEVPLKTRIKISATQQGISSKEWNKFTSREPYGIEWSPELKEQIIKRDSNRCQECGKYQRDIKRKLSVHHIDYDKKHNKPNNLITLCINCHLKTNTNRKYWKNHLKNLVFI